MSQELVASEVTLDELADRINLGYEKAMDEKRKAEVHVYSAMDRALEVGDLLRQAKSQYVDENGSDYGWVAWVKEHTSISDRTARDWMRLAGARRHVAGLGVREALKLLAEPKANKDTPESDSTKTTDQAPDRADTQEEPSSQPVVLFPAQSHVPSDDDLDEGVRERLDEVANQRGWNEEERALAVQNMTDTHLPDTLRQGLLAGKEDPILVLPDGQLAYLSSTIGRVVAEDKNNSPLLSVDRLFIALSDLDRFSVEDILNGITSITVGRILDPHFGLAHHIGRLSEILDGVEHPRQLVRIVSE